LLAASGPWINKWTVKCTPWDITRTSSGHLAVCGGTTDGAHIYNNKGQHKITIKISRCLGVGGVSSYRDHVLLTDSATRNVLGFSTEGEHVRTFQMGVAGIWGINVSGSKLYVTSLKRDGAVFCSNLQEDSEEVRRVLFCQHTGLHPLEDPTHIAANDRVVAVSCDGEYVQVYSTDGTHLTTLRDGLAVKKFTPRGVGVNHLNHILVADQNNSRIVAFGCSGELLTILKTDIEGPMSLYLAPTQSIWLCCYDSKLVCEYKYDAIQ
jgi:hypothetical protein